MLPILGSELPRLGEIHNGRGIFFPINVHGSVF
jgi:hypothetical protein